MTPISTTVKGQWPRWVTILSGWLPTPDAAEPAERRLYAAVRVGHPPALLVHVGFMALFAWWGVWPLVWVNVISVLLRGMDMARARRRGRLVRSLGIVFADDVAQSVLVWVFVGWGFGVQYVLVIWVVVFNLTRARLQVRLVLSLVPMVLFVAGYYYTALTDPRFLVPAGQLAAVNVLNIGAQFAVLALMVAYVSMVADRAEEALAVEQARSERLLTNVLPVPIAERLKEHEEVIADGVDGASVLFADIVGFTVLSAQRTPYEVVVMLNGVFTRLDALVDEFGLEKIKTIGDAYMVASGIPVPREDHAQVLARFALAARDELAEHNLTADVPVELRIGINSGPVVAGVIGRRRFLYDLWGDTVNTASRMESHGLPGQIQITGATRTLLDGEFTCIERGVIDVKGKGPTRTWLLEGERSSALMR
jgi:adenylate cyclase